MKTHRRPIVLVLLLALFAVQLIAPGGRASAQSGETLEITGELLWRDGNESKQTRPARVGVRLYADGREAAAAEANAENGWRFAFAVPMPAGDIPTYTVAADAVDGYTEAEAEHVDPAVSFVCPTGGTWTKYEPCNQLDIPAEKLSHEVIGGKMTKHQPFVIWSTEPLSAVERKLVWDSMKNRPGVGNPPEVVYISGEGASRYGMTVSSAKGTVEFTAPSDWALLFGGEYTRGSFAELAGRIVLERTQDGGEDIGEIVTPLPDEDPDEHPELQPDPLPDPDSGEESPTEPDDQGNLPLAPGDPDTDTLPESPEVPDPGTDVTEEPPLDNAPEQPKEEQPEELPDVLDGPAPVTPDVPVVPETPVTPDVPDVPNTPNVPDVPLFAPTAPEQGSAVTPAPVTPQHQLDAVPQTGLPREILRWAAVSVLALAGIAALLPGREKTGR